MQSDLLATRYCCFNAGIGPSQWVELRESDLREPLDADGISEDVKGGLEQMPKLTQELLDRDKESFDALLAVVRNWAVKGRVG